MTYSPTDLVCTGTFTLGGTDVSSEVTEVILKGMTNDVVIPPTFGNGNNGHAAGAKHHSIQIGYLSDDSATTTLFRKLWTAIGTASKELAFTVRYRPGAESPTNPQWGGTLVVSGADIGGEVDGLSTGSITCELTGAPSITEA